MLAAAQATGWHQFQAWGLRERHSRGEDEMEEDEEPQENEEEQHEDEEDLQDDDGDFPPLFIIPQHNMSDKPNHSFVRLKSIRHKKSKPHPTLSCATSTHSAKAPSHKAQSQQPGPI